MAKKKSSVALFEVINRTKRKHMDAGLSVPTWMTGPGHREDQTEPPSTYRPVSAAPPLPRAAAPVSEPAREPMVSTEPGRIRLSMTFVTAGIVAVTFLVLLIGVFILGRASAPAGTVTAEADLGQPTLDPGVLDRRPPAPPTGNNGGQRQRLAGKYYLVIQNTLGKTAQHKAVAGEIASWCARKGHPAEARQATTGYWVVWSYTPFDAPTSEDALAYAQQIEALGREYRRDGGQFDFRQRRNGQFDPLYLPQR